MNKTIIDLLNNIDPEKILYQPLKDSMIAFKKNKKENDIEVTFATSESNMCGNKVGIILWVDSDDLNRAIEDVS